MTENVEFSIHAAGPEYIPVLVDHHRRMFEEIIRSQNPDSDLPNMEDVDNAYRNKLNSELGQGCRAWVVQASDEIVASGAVSVISMVPVPNDCSSRVGLLHSIYTEKGYRNKGLGGRIVEAAVRYCTDQGMGRVLLNASQAGRSLYTKIGFESVDNAMRLWLNPNVA